ncbi:MAG: hypothetical protein NTX17_00830 [Candidatus Eisenbacteria bacterium]|nr:hypothetical protein [Candidatus Eisenbacteria bacterium]
MKREVPLIITAIFGCFMVIDFFVPHPLVSSIGETLQQWAIIVVAFAYVLGVANIARISGQKISRRSRDWFYQFPLLAGLVFMLTVGVVWGVGERTLFNDFYLYAYSPMQGTMFSLLAFFIASAAFRAFRLRSFEAALLAIAAIIVMLGRVPVGTLMWDKLPVVSDWIMNVPQMAAKRAIMIGAALGAISTGLKIILGIERNYLGGE